MSDGKNNQGKESGPPDDVQQGQTCLIAPKDYECIYSKAKESSGGGGGGGGKVSTNQTSAKTKTTKSKTSQKTSKSKKSIKSSSKKSTNKKPSDLKKKSRSKTNTKSKAKQGQAGKEQSKTTAVPANGSQGKMQPTEEAKQSVAPPAMQDAPTALIAPPDYVNIYSEAKKDGSKGDAVGKNNAK